MKFLKYYYNIRKISLFVLSFSLVQATQLEPQQFKQLLLDTAKQRTFYALESARTYANRLPAAYRSQYSAHISNAIFANVKSDFKAALLESGFINEEELELLEEPLAVIITLLTQQSAQAALHNPFLTDNDILKIQQRISNLGDGTDQASTSFQKKIQKASHIIAKQSYPRTLG